MKIKITKCRKKYYWYHDSIGETFEVLCDKKKDYLVYRPKNGLGGVSKSDCIILNEPLHEENELLKEEINGLKAQLEGAQDEIESLKDYIIKANKMLYNARREAIRTDQIRNKAHKFIQNKGIRRLTEKVWPVKVEQFITEFAESLLQQPQKKQQCVYDISKNFICIHCGIGYFEQSPEKCDNKNITQPIDLTKQGDLKAMSAVDFTAYTKEKHTQDEVEKLKDEVEKLKATSSKLDIDEEEKFKPGETVIWNGLPFWVMEDSGDEKVLVANSDSEKHPEYNDWWAERKHLRKE